MVKVTKHRNGDLTVTLPDDEARELWCLIREGRKAMRREYAAYHSDLALTLLRALPGDNDHARRMGDAPSHVAQ